jgi:hypothetical protein
MQREMSYALDGALSSRNQGQLVSTQTIQTKTMRTPGLTPVKDGPGGMGVPLKGGATMPSKGLGFVDVSLPVVGEVHWRSLILGGLVGLVVWKMSKKKRSGFSQRVASALAE